MSTLQLKLSAMIITARKRSLQRLCFYRCLSVHRGACMVGESVWWWGVHSRGCVVGGMHGRGACMVGVCGRGCAWWEVHGSRGMHGGRCMAGGHAWWRVFMAGVCAWWGMHGRGMCMAGGRGCAWQVDTMRYSQWVGGTHPTRMHSCCAVLLL